MDERDRAIVNGLQGGFPISERPYADVARSLGMSESELIARVDALVEDGTLSRFGPLFDAERLGGAVTLAAMRVPGDDLERTVDIVNAFPEVAHNYQREHAFNLWFVVSVDSSERIPAVLRQIEQQTGYRVYDFPKLEEFYIGLRLEV